MWWNCRIFRHRQYNYSNHLGNIGILLRYRSFPIYYYGTDNTERQSKIQQITALSNNNPTISFFCQYTILDGTKLLTTGRTAPATTGT